jgi:BirA family transcriptional regulator, biotin operon repressor / biotin---[acetyl-CoA-carboxylase] ligase
VTAGTPQRRLGTPRIHYRVIDSTNERARILASCGVAHGTLVTASEQSAGRGRQGRRWTAPPGRALLCSVVIRAPFRLLPLASGVAVAEVVGPHAALKWPNDLLVHGRKVAGILVEARAQEGWAVVGIGVNVALRERDFPPELAGTAGTLGLEPDAIEPMLDRLLDALSRWTEAPSDEVLTAFRARDALLGAEVSWADGHGRGAGIDGDGRLLVCTAEGRVALDAGEVHLRRPAA